MRPLVVGAGAVGAISAAIARSRQGCHLPCRASPRGRVGSIGVCAFSVRFGDGDASSATHGALAENLTEPFRPGAAQLQGLRISKARLRPLRQRSTGDCNPAGFEWNAARGVLIDRSDRPACLAGNA